MSELKNVEKLADEALGEVAGGATRNYLAALDAQRDQLARNLTAMGVQASESEKLNTLVPKVL